MQGSSSGPQKNPETSTLTGLSKHLEQWLEGVDGHASNELVQGCKDMCAVLDKARLDTEADLKQNTVMDEGLTGLLQRSMDAYAEMHQLVAGLLKTVAAEDRPASRELLLELRGRMAALVEAQEAMDATDA